MREIKFEFIFESGVKGIYSLEDITDPNGAINFAPIKHKRQYTGLKDKNGIEIYEGDIVEGISRSPKKNYIGKVHFDSIYGSWVIHGYDTEYSHMKFELSIPLGECRFNIKVIGNIYENPELMQ